MLINPVFRLLLFFVSISSAVIACDDNLFTPNPVVYSSLKSNYLIFSNSCIDYDSLNDNRLKEFYKMGVKVNEEYHFKKFNLNIYLHLQNLTYNKHETQAQQVLKLG